MKQTTKIFMLLALMVIGAGQAWADNPTYGKIFYEYRSSDHGDLTCFASTADASSANSANEIENDFVYGENGENIKYTYSPSLATLTNGTVYILAVPDFGYTGLGTTITAEISGGSDAAQARRRTPGGDNPGVGQTITVTPVNGHPGVYQFTMPNDGSNVTISATFNALPKATVNYIDPTKTGSAQNCTHEAYVLDGTEFYLGRSGYDTANNNEPYETWYVCNSDLTYNHYLKLYGDVHLILTDGKTMTINDANNQNAIGNNSATNYLTIYGQNGGTGTLNATAKGQNGSLTSEGITAWRITINGGKVSATGRYGINASFNFTVNGGEVTACNSNTTFPAIEATSVVINGGKVTANDYDDPNGTGIYASGDITINGGQVTAASAGNDNYGIHSTAGNITLGWTATTDFIKASSYYCENYYTSGKAVKTAEDQRFLAYNTDNDISALVSGSSDDSNPTFTLDAIAGKTLKPFEGYVVSIEDEYINIMEGETAKDPDFTITTGEGETAVTVPYYIYNEGDQVTLSYSRDGYDCTYKLNGTSIEGNTFNMPANDVVVTGDWVELGDLTVSCTLTSDLAEDANQVFTFTVTLSDTSISGTYGDMTFSDGVATVTLKGGHSATATGLPTTLTYIVTEADVEGFETGKTGDTGTIEATGSTATFTNTRETGDLELSNTVYADDNDDEFTFTVTLGDTSINGTYGDMTFTEGEVIVTLKGRESATATGLPTSLDYTVSQTDKEGYRLDGESSYSGKISSTKTEVTFTYTQLVNVKVIKVWDDANDQDGYRPDDVTVNLTKNGNIIDTVTLNEENSWTKTWTGLDKYNGEEAIDYTVSEDEVAEYTPNITVEDGTFNYTVTNRHEPEETEATVKKVWDDADNQDGYRPETLSVKLQADGEDTGETVTLSEDNDWEGKIENLPKYAAGKEIVYTWSEDGLPEGYALISNETVGTVTTITNSHETEETDVKVSKVWDDANDQDGYRPDDVTINLLADGKIIDTVTLSEENEWNYSWTKLDKKANGADIDYTVTENAVAEYTTNITKAEDGTFTYTVKNTHTTEETDVQVTKVWDDADDQDGYRPDDVTINLLADGKIIDTVTLSEENEWNYSWTKLDKKANGADIDYTVTENAVAEYTTNITKAEDGTFTYTVTNTYVPVTSGYCGTTGNEESVTWNYDTDTKTLSISGTGYMMYYNSVQNADESYSNGAPWKAFAEEIESVTIGSGITYVGSNTFAHCPNINSVTLPTSGIYEIGPGAFADCTGLESIDIPVSINNIGNQAFAGCSNLATVSIGYSDPGTFTLGSDVFPVTTTILVPENAYENFIKEKAVKESVEIDNPFYGYKDKIVPATRTFFASGTNTWMTWCDVNDWTRPEGCTAYTISSVSEDKVTLNEITAAENAPVIIPAYTPVLIYRETAGTDAVTATFSAVGTAPASGYDSETGIVTATVTGATFYGATANVASIPSFNAATTYVLYGTNFLRVENNNGIAKNRCWLVVNTADGARQLSIDFDTTGMSEELRVKSEEFAAATDWYDMQGRKLNGKPTKKGLYIHNGIKTVIK